MAGISDLKMENIRDVRACFYTGGTWTKNQLSRKTGLSLAGTTNVLKYLLEKKEILQSGKAASKAGRKSKQYILNPDSCHIGIVKILYGRWNHDVEISAMRLNGECVLSERAGDTLCDSGFLGHHSPRHCVHCHILHKHDNGKTDEERQEVVE